MYTTSYHSDNRPPPAPKGMTATTYAVSRKDEAIPRVGDWYASCIPVCDETAECVGDHLNTSSRLLGLRAVAYCLLAVVALFGTSCAMVLGPNPDGDEFLIADHNAVDAFGDIPDEYIDIVKTMLVQVYGESHAISYYEGLIIAEESNPERYALEAHWDTPMGPPPDPRLDALRLTKWHWNPLSTTPEHEQYYLNQGEPPGWVYHGGEEDVFTHNAARESVIDNLVHIGNVLSNPVDVWLFGWCRDMTSDYSPDGQWYGTVYTSFLRAAAGGDSIGGWDLTTSEPSLRDYLDAVDYINVNSSTLAVYTTGPLDEGSSATHLFEGQSGYQVQLKHDLIRDHVREGKSRILFDFADIIAHNDAGHEETKEFDDGGITRTFQVIHPDNARDDIDDAEGYRGTHMGRNASVRVGRALWWLLARSAGWDGT